MENFVLGAKRPLIISGPCSAETREQTLDTCVRLAATGVVDVLRAGIWKPRTRPGTFEGVGLKGLAWLSEAKRLTGLPIATEVASSKHVESALEFSVDVLWIGARTTVSPFAVQEIAEAVKGTDVKILIKNPMNPDISLWGGAVTRFLNMGIKPENIGLIHRGFSYFGHSKYRNPPMWHMILEMRRRFPDMMMICDPSHICGCRTYLQEISQTAADLRYDGLIVESHICPDKALSDAAQQLVPDELEHMIRRISWRKDSVEDPEFVKKLSVYRQEIDQIDSELFELLSRRMDICEKIGEVKRDNDVAILQSNRWGNIVDKVLSQADKLNLSPEFLKTVLEAIHIESINRQNKVMNA